eukprot:2987426-Amphidinium_carterae.1
MSSKRIFNPRGFTPGTRLMYNEGTTWKPNVKSVTLKPVVSTCLRHGILSGRSVVEMFACRGQNVERRG